MKSTWSKRRLKQTQRQTNNLLPDETFSQRVRQPRLLSPADQTSPPVRQAMQAPRPAGRRVPIDMNLPGDKESFYQARLKVYGRRWLALQRWAFRSAIIIVVLVIGLGSFIFSQGYLKVHKVFRGTAKPVAALQPNVSPSLLKTEGDGRINILLLGRGGGTHAGPDLTDTMMLASIDPVNHTAILLSIPRDLWIDIANVGNMKINAAWETGEFRYEGKIAPGSTDPQAIQAGFTLADQVVSNILGVSINYNMIVDFQAFQQAVDTIGGVSVTVPSELYDPTMAWENGNNPVLALPGQQSFTGNQALNYVRSRETTSDFARAQRQRAVLLAIKHKAESLGTVSNPLKLSGLLNEFGNNVATDMSMTDAEQLYSVVKDINPAAVTSLGLADAPNNYVTTGSAAGQSIDMPTAGLYNYSAIQSYVRSQLKDPYLTKENAKVLVLNGSLSPGLARSVTSQLASYGYNVMPAGNAPTNGYTNTIVVDVSHGIDKYTAHFLANRFQVPVTNVLPDKSIQTNGANFVIILGSNETNPR